MQLHAHAIFSLLLVTSVARSAVLLDEHFDDASLVERGWFDVTSVTIDTSGCHLGGCLRYHYEPGEVLPSGMGPLRVAFAETDVVFVRYFTRYSATWQFRPSYGPHEIQLLTNLDDRWIGPAQTHLTAYVEHVEGKPLISGQDTLNIDQARIGQDLTMVTDARGAHGCNGAADSHGVGDCYASGDIYRNGKSFGHETAPVVFSASTGPYYQGGWHEVIVEIRLNDVTPSATTRNGRARYWFDRVPVIDIRDTVWRTGANPTMRFCELVLGPYYHDGAPQAQDGLFDELRVATAASEVGLTQSDTVPRAPRMLGVSR